MLRAQAYEKGSTVMQPALQKLWTLQISKACTPALYQTQFTIYMLSFRAILQF